MYQEGESRFFEQLQAVEQRYAFENQLMEVVRKGQTQKLRHTLQTLSTLPPSVLISRIDPVRDAKNYTIVLNTLMRKAAEQGGVHPVYIDHVSTAYALRIERILHWPGFLSLWQQMIAEYCHLVSKHAAKRYSPLVQKVISRIELDLASELRLAPLAQALKVNPSYLSTLFKRETGQTLTAFVTARRMEYAEHLLSTGQMRISAVAQSCGIPDDNYFAKLFKRHCGLTPAQYRKNRQQVKI